jgi:hypothetical protein
MEVIELQELLKDAEVDTTKHTVIYPGSEPSTKVIAVRIVVCYRR